ncbi:CUB and sushi domain-containing protein 3 isoform X2 [Rhipicephalus sanguineus]|uniref:CUB and sushi domain-containing protein 3 isoform X2 n=1 Tax=Rhipicephalus sanguineus TaxID=34632 RepID=UPI00189610C9|nr:CUB and sushi domain-containing protein 3 isoform X2 [Rhipicephalus sanguineus]
MKLTMESDKLRRLWQCLVCPVGYLLLLTGLPLNISAVSCPPPAVPLYATVSFTNGELSPGTVATYTCDPGYELFGSATRSCSDQGRWVGGLPYCAVNVAYGKPTNQSSTVRGGDSKNANDGDLTTLHENRFCTETKLENAPWWQVDLLRPYQVRVVRVLTRGCCGHQPLHDLEIRVSNQSSLQGSRLCAWYPGTLEDGSTKDFECAYPILGRYVYIHMVGGEGSLSLCEVMVFTTQEFSPDRCGNQVEPLELTTFIRKCYEFQGSRGGSFQDASSYCQARGGLLVHSVDDLTLPFISAELERRREKLKSKLVWMGAQRRTGIGPGKRGWFWVSGEPVREFLWADDQPNNYNGQQNCVVIDGGRKWRWNDVTCDLDYLPWICQYNPSNCGSPDREENSTTTGRDYRVGQEVVYECPTGSLLVGTASRKCATSGFWTGAAPSCKYLDCGAPDPVDNGRIVLLHGRTTYNATVEYVCDTNYTLVGQPRRICGPEGRWNGTKPSCLQSYCTMLSPVPSSSLDVQGRRYGDRAHYKCDIGHKLIGNDTRYCQLGGTWSGDDPTCKYIDCGEPRPLEDGDVYLVNGTSTYLSVSRYSCGDNFTLNGVDTRTCLETGLWSDVEPSCEMISCGEPEIPLGGYVIEEDFQVHDTVHYKCHPGHIMDGPDSRTCLRNGQWSDIPPTCTFVDCGRVPPILKGEVSYENGSTYLGSQIAHSCSQGYRLNGVRVRTCGLDGRWNGTPPKCEEIRCPPPEIPKNATVVYGGNDRSSSESFKIGSTVQYRCVTGHIVQGESLRTCQATGRWTAEVPQCVYVECTFPLPIGNGHWLLSTNSTHYGATVEYECDKNYHLDGAPRRLCLENGTWSGPEPLCLEVRCPEPKASDSWTVIKFSSSLVGSSVEYSCESGYELEGLSTRVCQSSGRWSGQAPNCTLVDCGNPSVISNGRGLIMNGTTTFGSMVEYECLHDFKLIGDAIRTCGEDGHWSGQEPRCTDIPMIGNDIEGADSNRADFTYDSSRTVGIAIAVGAGALLVIAIVVAIVWMRTKAQRVKNTENVDVNRGLEKDNATVMSFSRLALEAADANSSAPYSNGIRHNPNGLVTFAAGPQPIYANVTVNGQNLTSPTTATSVARINLGVPPSPPHAPPRQNNNNNNVSHHAHHAYGSNRGPAAGMNANGHHMSSTLQSHDV